MKDPEEERERKGKQWWSDYSISAPLFSSPLLFLSFCPTSTFSCSPHTWTGQTAQGAAGASSSHPHEVGLDPLPWAGVEESGSAAEIEARQLCQQYFDKAKAAVTARNEAIRQVSMLTRLRNDMEQRLVQLKANSDTALHQACEKWESEKEEVQQELADRIERLTKEHAKTVQELEERSQRARERTMALLDDRVSQKEAKGHMRRKRIIQQAICHCFVATEVFAHSTLQRCGSPAPHIGAFVLFWVCVKCLSQDHEIARLRQLVGPGTTATSNASRSSRFDFDKKKK